jgi:hypothetical protein
MTKKFHNPTPVKYIDVILWQDAYTTHDKNPEFEKGENTLTVSVGIVVKEDKEFLHISHFYDGIANEFNEPYTSIPLGMIKHRKRVKI